MANAAAMPVAERDRKRIVRLVVFSFWLLIFEGSLRKWVAPQYSQYLYFVRDPVALYVYAVALRAGVFRNQSLLLYFGMSMAALVAVLCVPLVLTGRGQYTPILALYGLRNYFLYIPLAFVIGRCFEFDDIRRIAHHCLLAMLVAAPLAVLQFNAPASHALNVGIAADGDLQFANLTAGGGKVRPAGTFTSAVGMSHLIPICVAFLMWSWSSSRKPPPIKFWFAGVAALAVATALAVSGSRTSFIYSCLVILAGIVTTPARRGAGTRWRSMVIPVVLVIAFAFLFPVVFPAAFESFTARWAAAEATEGTGLQPGWLMRALHGLYDFVRVMGTMPVQGYGVGMAGNGASITGVTLNGVNIARIAEEDWTRHVVELGPALAVVFIAWRISFAAWLGSRAWRAMLHSGDSLPLILFVFAAVPLIHGQITGHGLVNGFGWLFIGVCIAATRVMGLAGADSPTRQPAAPVSLAADMPFPNLMR